MQCLKHKDVLSCPETTTLISKNSVVKIAQDRCGTDQAVASLPMVEVDTEMNKTQLCFVRDLSGITATKGSHCRTNNKLERRWHHCV